MWKWMNFLHQKLPSLDEGNDPGDRETLPTVLCPAIEGILGFFIGQHAIGCITVLMTEGILELALDLWVKLAESPPQDGHVFRRVAAMSNVVLTLLQSPLTDSAAPTAAIVRRGPTQAADYLFKPFRICIHANPPWREDLPFLATKSVISTLCEGLAYAATLPSLDLDTTCREGGDEMQPQGNVVLLLNILGQYSTSIADGYSWVIYALRRDPLLALLGVAHHCDDDKVAAKNIELLLEDLGKYTIYRPILRRLRPMLYYPAPEESRHEMIWVKWLSLVDKVTSALATEIAFDRLEKYTPQCVYWKVRKLAAGDNAKASTDPKKYNAARGANLPCIAPTFARGATGLITVRFVGQTDQGLYVNVSLARDFLTSTRTTFFRYLLDSEMVSRDKAIMKELDRFRLTIPLSGPKSQPLVLLFDYDDSIPPTVPFTPLKTSTNSPTQIFNGNRYFCPVSEYGMGHGIVIYLFPPTSLYIFLA
ncbi:hypothetical protein DXG01_011392 [Tephrocybe rancida]|nr:hypothetical protein DXG01_011392 [Tephrocybe rancida]